MPISPLAPRTRRAAAALVAIATLPSLASVASSTLAAQAPHPARAAAASPLVVSPAWLAEHLHDRGLVILHVGEEHGFQAAHVPGAHFARLEDVSRPMSHERPAPGDTSLMLELPSPADLARQLEELGISSDSRVVVYFADEWVSPATRVIFALDAAGLGSRTSLLDGGLGAWTRAGLPVETKVLTVRRGTLRPASAPPPVVSAAWVQAHERAPGVKIVDARAPVFYAGPGSSQSRQRHGHIPGAVSIPFTELVDDSLRVRPPADLERLFADAGIQRGDTVAVYCHVGQQGTAIVFAARLLGYPARLYDGSFQEWSRRSDLAVDSTSAPAVGASHAP